MARYLHFIKPISWNKYILIPRLLRWINRLLIDDQPLLEIVPLSKKFIDGPLSSLTATSWQLFLTI